jgi:hypothetical protein
MRLPRITSIIVALTYCAAILLAPILHQLHHARYGADHVHTALGTQYTSAHTHREFTWGEAHVAFENTLADANLLDVGLAGAADVDCSLAAYTLVECDGSLNHAPRFGDLINEHAPPTSDLQHGRGSLEHLGVALIDTPHYFVAPPVTQVVTLTPPAAISLPSARVVDVLRCRGPPRSA